MVESARTEVIYAAAPVPTLERIAAFCRERRIPSQVAVEERMACGLGFLALLGLGLAATAGAAAAAGASGAPALAKVAGILLTVLVNIGLYVVAFRLESERRIR